MKGYKLEEIWLFPVKGCQGFKVDNWPVTESGLDLDRAFCVVDALGKRYPIDEVISPRRMPCLLKIETRLEGRELVLRAPQVLDELRINVDETCEGRAVTIRCSDTNPGSSGWNLGSLQGQVVNERVSTWLTSFLNAADDTKKTKECTQFELVRTFTARPMKFYPPTFPLLENCSTDAKYQFSSARFHDFAPFLLANRASQGYLSQRLDMDRPYPLEAFRANLIVSSPNGEAWEEEEWDNYSIGELSLKRIKRCPRCTMTLRDRTGEWVMRENKVKLHKVLGEDFPEKTHDPEWGSWSGPIFGVFTGFSSSPKPGTQLRVGDLVKPGDGESKLLAGMSPFRTIISRLKKDWRLLLAVIIAVLFLQRK